MPFENDAKDCVFVFGCVKIGSLAGSSACVFGDASDDPALFAELGVDADVEDATVVFDWNGSN